MVLVLSLVLVLVLVLVVVLVLVSVLVSVLVLVCYIFFLFCRREANDGIRCMRIKAAVEAIENEERDYGALTVDNGCIVKKEVSVKVRVRVSRVR